MWPTRCSLRWRLNYWGTFAYVVDCTQSSFIHERSMVDNILVLQECVHCMNNMKGKMSYMIIKLDLEKAYDRLEWNFISNTLWILDTRPIPNNLIEHCILIFFHVHILEWGQTYSLVSSWGLRQGDLIYPYLFVLALESFRHIIYDLVNSNFWKPLNVSRESAPKITHVCFVHDIVLIAEASMEQGRFVRSTLQEFCLKSGKNINLNKYKVFFCKNVGDKKAT